MGDPSWTWIGSWSGWATPYLPQRLPDRTFHLSVSMGSPPPSGLSVTLEEFIDAADERMYEDKRAKQQEAQPVWSI